MGESAISVAMPVSAQVNNYLAGFIFYNTISVRTCNVCTSSTSKLSLYVLIHPYSTSQTKTRFHGGILALMLRIILTVDHQLCLWHARLEKVISPGKIVPGMYVALCRVSHAVFKTTRLASKIRILPVNIAE